MRQLGGVRWAELAGSIVQTGVKELSIYCYGNKPDQEFVEQFVLCMGMYVYVRDR